MIIAAAVLVAVLALLFLVLWIQSVTYEAPPASPRSGRRRPKVSYGKSVIGTVTTDNSTGPPIVKPTSNPDDSTVEVCLDVFDEEIKVKVLDIYREHNPSKTQEEIHKICAQYQGREEELLRKLTHKYVDNGSQEARE